MKVFHQCTYDLLEVQPRRSEAAIELVSELDSRCGGRLPAAVKEWYSLDGAVNILAKKTSDHLVPLEELGKVFDDWYGGGRRDFVAEGYLVIMTENQGVCNWAVPLNSEEEDPPVLVEVESSPNVVWKPFADRFSIFVNTIVCDWIDSIHLCAQDTPLADKDLGFLREHFTEGYSTYNWPAKQSYRFRQQDQYILVWAGEDQTDWHLAADSADSLYELVRTVWHCGSLSDSLYEADELGSIVLERMRDSEH